jgi:hypothetical protein
MKLTVLYDGQYWVAVVEQQENGRLKVARHIFGSEEPGDPEVALFVHRELLAVIGRVATTVSAEESPIRRISPKRAARQAAREVAERSISSKAQEALKLELEHRKLERRQLSKAQREQHEAYKRQIRILKRKAKHRGH